MSSARVSVIIPTYNRAGLVGRAVNSALASCRASDEIIVIDDGSTDDTEERLRVFGDRIVYVRTANGGAGRARNFGVHAASNPLVAFLDSDDEWIPGGLERKRALMQSRADVLFCFSNFAVRDERGVEHHDYLVNWHQDRRDWNEILGPGAPLSTLTPLTDGQEKVSVHIGDLYLQEMSANYIFTSTLVVRREAAGDALHFADDLRTYEDWECYGRLARAGTAAYLDCETAWQHGHEGPRLTVAPTLTSLSARIAVLERVWGSDAVFLTKHSDRYHHLLEQVRLEKVRNLISEGKTPEARREVHLTPHAPLLYRVLARVPGPVTLRLLHARSLLRRRAGA